MAAGVASSPTACGGYSAPSSTYGYNTRWQPTTEPDIAVVRGAIRDYMEAHPTSAVLVVEVSNESLRYDRTVKQHLYARCRIPEYWILALPEACLEVYRDPAGDGYQSVTNRAAGDKVAPLARPDAEIAVDDLLP